MLYMALMFLVVALIAGVLGITGIAGLSAQIAWILFVVGLILAVVSFVFGRRGLPYSAVARTGRCPGWRRSVHSPLSATILRALAPKTKRIPISCVRCATA